MMVATTQIRQPPELRDSASARLDPRATILAQYGLSDGTPDPAFDELACLAGYIGECAAALICFFTAEDQWIKGRWARRGEGCRLQPPATPLYDISLHQPGEILTGLAVEGAAQLFAPMKLNLQAAMPLCAPDGEVLGAILLADRQPLKLHPRQSRALKLLAAQIVEQLELRRTLLGLSQANGWLAQQAVTDFLTATPNRRALDKRLDMEIARAGRTGDPLCLLLLDIDHFKAVNDEFGHQAGDTTLQEVARILQAGLRPYDFLARYGGEEFAVLLPATNLADALVVAERLRATIAGTGFTYGRLTISLGVSRLDPASGAQALMMAADNGLYRAKAAGRNRVLVGKLNPDDPSGSARL